MGLCGNLVITSVLAAQSNPSGGGKNELEPEGSARFGDSLKRQQVLAGNSMPQGFKRGYEGWSSLASKLLNRVEQRWGLGGNDRFTTLVVEKRYKYSN